MRGRRGRKRGGRKDSDVVFFFCSDYEAQPRSISVIVFFFKGPFLELEVVSSQIGPIVCDVGGSGEARKVCVSLGSV